MPNASLYALPLAALLPAIPHLYAIALYSVHRASLSSPSPAPSSPSSASTSVSGPEKKRGGKRWDNADPRSFVDGLRRAPPDSDPAIARIRRRILRAEAAQQNGYENVGVFAAAVLAANFVHLPIRQLNALAFLYLFFRVLYTYVYVIGDSRRLAGLRTLLFYAASICQLRLFFLAASVLYHHPSL